MTALLDVDRVTRRFGGVVANADVSFGVAPGEIVGVIGPNGAGKSTLFDVITGFCRPDAGEVRLAGAPITGLRPDASTGSASPARSRSSGRSPA